MTTALGLYIKYSKLFAHTVECTIGKSDVHQNWEIDPAHTLLAWSDWNWPLATNSRGAELVPSAFLDLDVQAFDLLVQRRQRNLEVLCRLRLVPVAAFEPVRDNASLNLFH